MLTSISDKAGSTLSRGQFFAITSVIGEEGIGILERLFVAYSANSSLKSFNALQNAVETSAGSAEIAVSILVDTTIYSAAVNGARIAIRRGGSTGTIIQSTQEKVSTASGYPKNGDIMLLSTSNGESALTLKFEQKSLISRILKRLPERKIYIHETLQEATYTSNKKLTFTVSLVLLLLLFVSIAFGIRQKKVNSTKNQYQTIISQAQDEVDQAISLASIDPGKSRELFADSEQKLQQILGMKVNDTKVDELKKKIEDSRQGILGEYTGTPELFLNLTLLSSGFSGNVVKSSGGNIYVLDKNGKRIVSVAYETKKSKVVAGPSVMETANDLGVYEERVFVLDSDGIYEVGNTKNGVINKEWGGEAFIQIFGGNMYVLDKAGNQIYRYTGSGNSFGSKQNWLSGSTNANFGDAKTWGIDGAVYVLYPNAKILKYSQGSSQSFKLSGVIPEVGNLDAINADPDNQYLYLLDRAGQRVIVTDKKGVYKAQYKDSEIGNAVSLVASELSKKIILLTGDKLLVLPMKHL